MKKIFENTLYLNISVIIARIAGLTTSIILARKLGNDAFGQLTYIFSFTSLFMILTDAGISSINVRNVAADENKMNEKLSEGIDVKIFLSGINLLFFCALLFLLKESPALKAGLAAGFLYVIIKSFGSFYISFYSGMERFGYNAVFELFYAFTVLSGVFALSGYSFGLLPVMGVYLFSAIVWCLLIFMVLKRKFIRQGIKISLKPKLNLLKESYPFATISLLSVFLYQSEVVILKHFHGNASTGIYGVALALYSGLIFVIANFGSAAFPSFVRSFNMSKDRLKENFEKSIRLLFIIAFPIAIGGILLSDKIVELFYGSQYTGSALCLKILFPALFLHYFGTFFATLLLSVKMEKLGMMILFYAVLMTIAADFLLIPRFDFIGASIVRLSANLLLAVFTWLAILKNIFVPDIFKKLLKPVLAGLIMAAVLLLLAGGNLFIAVTAGILTYFASLFIMGEFNPAEYDFIVAFIKGRMNGL